MPQTLHVLLESQSLFMSFRSKCVTLIGKMSMTSPLPLPQLPKFWHVPTRRHLHLLRTDARMQRWPWIRMGKKQHSNMRQDFRQRKSYIVCPLYTLIAVLKVFLICLFPFSPPLSPLEWKKIRTAEGMKSIQVFLLDLLCCLLLPGPCLEECNGWESWCVEVTGSSGYRKDPKS